MSDLVIFDFDWSLVNENSDTWIFQKLAPHLHQEVRSLSSAEYKNRWTELMDHLVHRMISENGTTIDEIRDCLCAIPVFTEILDAIKLIKKNGADLRILSDANDFYIDTILKHHNLDGHFTSIVTNYANVRETIDDHMVRIFPYQGAETPHHCERCPPNLCKGSVFDKWINIDYGDSFGTSTAPRIIYIGDGGGDICPAAKLSPSDWLLCRKDWTLHKATLSEDTGGSGIRTRSNDSESIISAQIVPWQDGADILHFFEELYPT